MARFGHKLFAYKDEYEVARLHLRNDVGAALAEEFPGGVKIQYNLHPPLLRALGLDRGMVQQYRPDEKRKHRADFAWPEHRLLLEVDGGTWNGGKHGRGSGIEKDNEKQALAVINGFRTLRASTSQVRSGVAAQWVEAAIAGLTKGEDR